MQMVKIDRLAAQAALRVLQAKIGGNIKGHKLYPLADYFAKLVIPPPVQSLNRRTYIAQTYAQQESRVADAMREKGLDVYLPQEPKSIRVNASKRRVIKRAMLLGYVLPIFDEIRDEWQRIRDIRGVIRLFMIRERPVPLADVELQKIQRREAELNDGGLSRVFAKTVAEVGDCVQIIDHPAFNGFIGMVMTVCPKRWRLAVEVDLFGQKVPLDINADQVRLAG